MTDFTRRVNFVAGDKSGVASIQAAAIAAKGMQAEIAKAKTATSALNDAMAEINRKNQLDAAAKSAARYASETGNARASQIKLNAELTKMGATANEIRRVAAAYDNELTRSINDAARAQERLNKGKFNREHVGDLSTSLSSLASVGGAFGNGAGNEALRIGSDITGFLEYGGRLKDAIKAAGEQAAASSGLIGNLATAAQSAVPGLGAAGAGLAATAAVALPFVAAMGAIALALAEADKNAQAMNEAYKTFAAQRAAERAAQGLTTSEAQKALADAKARAAEQQKIVSDNAAILNQFYSEAQQQIPVIGDLAARFHDSRGAFNDTRKDITAAKEALTLANAEIAALEKTLKSGALAENDRALAVEKATADLKTAESELANVRQQHGATIAQLKTQENELNQAYTRSVIARSAARGLADSRENEDRDIAAANRAADLQRQLAQDAIAHNKNLATIAQRGADAIISARVDLAKRETDSVKQIAAIQDAYRRDEIKAQADFAKQQRRDLADFRRDEARAQRDYKRSQLENLINNDVTGAILDQDAYNTDRRRNRQDFRRGRNREQADFDAERQAAFEATQEKIAEIQRELEEYRLATAAKIAQIETQTAADLEAAQAAHDEKLRLDQERRDIEEQREAAALKLKLDRRAEDRRNEDALARAAHLSSLDRITELKTAQETALNSAIAKANEFKNVVENIRVGGTGQAAPIPTLPAYGGYIPTPGSDKFYEDPKQGAPKAPGGLGGVQFAGAQGLGRMPRGATGASGGGGGNTFNVYIDGKLTVNKPVIDAIARGITQAINNPTTGQA